MQDGGDACNPLGSELPRAGDAPMREIRLISCDLIRHVSDIKLIRTDTTLDLSQKAEKGMSLSFGLCALLYATADKTEREGYME